MGTAIAAATLYSATPVAAADLVAVDAKGVRRLIEAGSTELTLLNVWATWCEPCKEEFPELLAIGREYDEKGVRLLFVTTDFGEAKAAAVRFLKAQGAALPSYVKSGKDEAFIEALSPDWVGTLPATFVFDRQGRLLHFHQGRIDRAKLESVLDGLLAPRERQEVPR